MKIINDNQGNGREGIVLKNREDVESIVWLKEWLLEVIEEKESKDEIREEILKGLKRQGNSPIFTEEDTGLLVVSDKILSAFHKEYTDIL